MKFTPPCHGRSRKSSIDPRSALERPREHLLPVCRAKFWKTVLSLQTIALMARPSSVRALQPSPWPFLSVLATDVFILAQNGCGFRSARTFAVVFESNLLTLQTLR